MLWLTKSLFSWHLYIGTTIWLKSLRWEIFGFFSSRSLKMRERYICFAQLVLLSLYIFWEKCVYFSIFEWWNQVDSGWIGWETLTFWKKIDFQIGFLQTNFLLNSLDLKVTNAKISLDSQSEGVPMHANCQKVNKVQLPTFIFCW